jgi:hypothetical protein
LLYCNVSTDFFALLKRFLEIYANERNRTEAAVGFVQHSLFRSLNFRIFRLNCLKSKTYIYLER